MILIISERCAPTPPQCPLPSILIAVCVPMSSYCDFYGMCAQHLVAFVGGNYVIFFTKARCECLLPLPYGPRNPCQILQILVPNRRGGTPRRALSAPKRPKGTQERLKGPPETTKKRLRERLGALLRRFGRVLGAAGASRGGPGSPKWMQNRHTIFLKRVSVTVSGSDLVFPNIF